MTVADSPARPAESDGAAGPGPKPILDGTRGLPQQIGVYVFVMVPLLALVAAIPLAVGWGLLGWSDVVIGLVFYVVSGLGITVGYHRYFTHGSFKANRPLRIGLAVAGSLAMQGPVIDWVADHRRHHAFSDKEGDPHSPWLHGSGPLGLAKGFWHSHMGWLFDRDQTNEERFTPDLLADTDIRRVDALFGLWSVLTLLVPAGLGALVTWSWQGALTALFWAGLVRVGLLHHVTWSINSICHMWGDRPFAARDRSANVWPLAIASFGESWHNLHHADPTCARHGVKRGQVDISARVIRTFEKLGWATAVRWPTERRLQRIAREA
ncbi:acyl-CoA desaturase [Pseudonocardia benzenivorans]|jgi:stearoyl-CoA desaturase (delta-9 desaturase)|uniref:Stearoyl-CoA 9-desaturase n=2 Tax=Pseudonocardia TaxID=1847 RepID=F4D154_PSEUX|nr:acyl-CoA desaturase [Pseudonocardia dioxanivorans]AEA26842.1 Stearoyl-CoA 9-desaturase [Pseudonocardia dioxanivorans CB1190]GJF03708.1 stearoyl-CoA desaturase [Pseudonocardia sp. D17]